MTSFHRARPQIVRLPILLLSLSARGLCGGRDLPRLQQYRQIRRLVPDHDQTMLTATATELYG